MSTEQELAYLLKPVGFLEGLQIVGARAQRIYPDCLTLTYYVKGVYPSLGFRIIGLSGEETVVSVTLYDLAYLHRNHFENGSSDQSLSGWSKAESISGSSSPKSSVLIPETTV